MSRDFEAQQEAASGRRKVRYLAGQAVYDVPPGTLAEVLSDVRRGQLFQYALSRFLIEFHGDPDPASRRRRISDEPELGPNQCLNAILGAAGEHLARRWDLGEPPLWTTRPERFMDQPYFMNLHLPKSRLFEESPTAFRAKQLRGEANALQRRISQLTWQHCPLGQNLAHPLLQHRKIGYAR
jgi:hypothetical protein